MMMSLLRSCPGHGAIKAGQGICPIPTPAMLRYSKGAPLAIHIKAELTTRPARSDSDHGRQSWLGKSVMTSNILARSRHQGLAEQPNVLRLFVGTAAEHRHLPL